MSHDLFRKAALDKLASPERLDVLMQVTPPKDFIARLTALALALALLAWGVFGSSPDAVSGRGEIRGGGGRQDIVAVGDGSLVDFTLTESTRVEAGELIATIQEVGGEGNSQMALAAWQEAERLASEARGREAGEIARNQARQGELRSQLMRLENELATTKELVDRGDKARKELDSIEDRVNQARTQLTQVEQQVSSANQRIRDAESSARQARIDYEKVGTTKTVRSEVRSTVAGVVTEVLKNTGDRVSTGDVLARIEVDSTGAALEVIAYVPASFGRRIEVGHPVQVIVAGIKREEHGFLRGRISFFSEATASEEEVFSVTKERGSAASYQIRVEMIEDANTDSGYAWSTGKGPPEQLSGGVRADVTVEVGTRRPITLAWLRLRGMFGI